MMNDKAGVSRRQRDAAALSVAACLAVLAAACGGSAPSAASAPAYTQELALAQCIRGHGVPNFPDPGQSGQGAAPGNGGAINPDSPQFQAALSACQHLLPAGVHVSVNTSKSAS